MKIASHPGKKSLPPSLHAARKVTDVDSLVGHNLRTRRLEKGWSQEKLAAALGVTFQQVQKYEMGRNRISASRLFARACPQLAADNISGFTTIANRDALFTSLMEGPVDEQALCLT